MDSDLRSTTEVRLQQVRRNLHHGRFLLSTPRFSTLGTCKPCAMPRQWYTEVSPTSGPVTMSLCHRVDPCSAVRSLLSQAVYFAIPWHHRSSDMQRDGCEVLRPVDDAWVDGHCLSRAPVSISGLVGAWHMVGRGGWGVCRRGWRRSRWTSDGTHPLEYAACILWPT